MTARGASLLEYVVVLASVLAVVALALSAIGTGTTERSRRVAACIRSGSCEASPVGEAPVFAGARDPSLGGPGSEAPSEPTGARPSPPVDPTAPLGTAANPGEARSVGFWEGLGVDLQAAWDRSTRVDVFMNGLDLGVTVATDLPLWRAAGNAVWEHALGPAVRWVRGAEAGGELARGARPRPSLWGNRGENLDLLRAEAQAMGHVPTPREFAAARALVEAPRVPLTRALTAGIQNVADELASLPPEIVKELADHGVTIRVAEGRIASELPANLANHHPDGFPPGVTLGDGNGVFLSQSKEIIVAVDGAGRVIDGGSVDALKHEVGHALDQARGYPSRSAAFEDARALDLQRGGVDDSYFMSTAEGGAQRTTSAALSETYAESFALYQRGTPTLGHEAPHISEYWRSVDPSPPTIPWGYVP